MSTLKTILLMIGSAIAGIVIFIAGVAAFFTYMSSSDRENTFSFGGRPTVVTQPPALAHSQRFLGTMGSFGSEFKHAGRGNELSAGPGEIIGSITVDGKGRAGLRIRLALNASVMSQWGTSQDDGKYAIPVPYGEYRVDGYEVDHEQVQAALSGKTDNPQNRSYHHGDTFTVAEGKPGRGIELDYIDPVVVIAPKGDVSVSGPIVVSWKPYPNAALYRIQVEEFKRSGDYRSERRLFEWEDQPVVSETSFDLTAKGVKLQPGFYYLVSVDALDGRKGMISTTGNRFASVDFHVTQ